MPDAGETAMKEELDLTVRRIQGKVETSENVQKLQEI
jgi:hypothetical protein